MNTPQTNLSFQLFKAAKKGDRESFDALATQNSPTTILSFCTIHRNDTLLHISAGFGHHELTQHISNQFPSLLTCKNFIGDTPLHVAAAGGKLLVVTSLLTMNNPESNYLHAANEDGNTPLHEAVMHNRDEVVEFLLRKTTDFKEVVLKVNKKGKSPLYLAVESRNTEIVNKILNICGGTTQNGTSDHVDHTNASLLQAAILETRIGNSRMIANPLGSSVASTVHARVDEGAVTTKSVLHAAVAGKDIGILRMVAENLPPALVDNDNHLLHLAASLGFLDGVNYLLDKFSMNVFSHDDDGFCPIHLASTNGHLQVTKALLDYYSNAREFLSRKHQNILHVAAENGKNNIVQYILKTEWAEFLLNEKDKDGYTPLHLATNNWHPKVITALTWDVRVDLKHVNKEGLTALEVAEKYMEEMAPFKKRLTWMALKSAGTPRAHIKDIETMKRLEATKYEPYNINYCKARVNTLLLVSALVATVTFSAGFTMPGGNNNSGPHVGMVTMLHKIKFLIFLICDSIAMYSSIIVTVMLMWAQLGDLNLSLYALRKAQKLLGLSLVMMSLAFLAGVDLVVTEFLLLSIAVLVLGILALIVIVALFVPLFLPYTSEFIIFRYISYYPFKWLMLVS